MRAPDEASPFLRKVRQAIRVRHYSIRTEEAYVQWVKRFIVFHGKRHPSELREAEVATFLTHLAVVGNVASSTQNQALNALVFLYGKVLSRPLAECVGIVRAKRSQRVPTVLTQTEVGRILANLNGLLADRLFAVRVRLETIGEHTSARQGSREALTKFHMRDWSAF